MSSSWTFKVLFIFCLITTTMAQIGFIKGLIESNVLGVQILHKDQDWEFDPDVGQKRSRFYQELNGNLGEKAIERLGLGIDGRDQERLTEQRARDEGHLNGVDYLTP